MGEHPDHPGLPSPHALGLLIVKDLMGAKRFAVQGAPDIYREQEAHLWQAAGWGR